MGTVLYVSIRYGTIIYLLFETFSVTVVPAGVIVRTITWLNISETIANLSTGVGTCIFAS